ncbi:MAG: DUF6152 family protein, partial [Burkholderiaceae bacterium]
MKKIDDRFPLHSQDRRLVMKAVAGGLGLLGSGISPAVWAHHGWSSFDQARPLYLQGKALEVKWRNPHAELVLERSPGPIPAELARRIVLPREQARQGLLHRPLPAAAHAHALQHRSMHFDHALGRI